MSERDETNGNPPLEDLDPGEPIEALAELEEKPPGGFFERVQARIERRRLGSQLVDMVWYIPFIVFLEFVSLVYRLFQGERESKEEGG